MNVVEYPLLEALTECMFVIINTSNVSGYMCMKRPMSKQHSVCLLRFASIVFVSYCIWQHASKMVSRRTRTDVL